MKDELVSIIIPLYNEERYVNLCINSILNQTYPNIEIILINDGSTDNTGKIIEIYREKGVKIFTIRNSGPAIARNFGAKQSHGNILIFLDGDMKFESNYVENLIKPILEGNAIGTDAEYEYIANLDNIWAKIWSRSKYNVERSKEKKGYYFRAILRKKFFEIHGFSPDRDYYDDHSLYEKSHWQSQIAKNTICYHYNPTSASESFEQTIWLARSLLKSKSDFKSSLQILPKTIVSLFPSYFWLIVLIIGIKMPLFIPFYCFIYFIYLELEAFYRMRPEKDMKYLIYYPIYKILSFIAINIGLLKYLDKKIRQTSFLDFIKKRLIGIS